MIKKYLLQTLTQYNGINLIPLGLLLVFLVKPNKTFEESQTMNIRRLIRACVCDSVLVLPVDSPYSVIDSFQQLLTWILTNTTLTTSGL